MKKFAVFLLLISFTISFTSCGGDNASFPRHLCKTFKELQKNVDDRILLPTFIVDLDDNTHSVKYYYTAEPRTGGLSAIFEKTGYFIEITSTQSAVPPYLVAHCKGIDLDKAELDTDIFKTDLYQLVHHETITVTEETVIMIETYRNRDNLTNANSTADFTVFTAYVVKENVNYSITFSSFKQASNLDLYEICLSHAKQYFELLNIEKD